jgi:hypothetical protein
VRQPPFQAIIGLVPFQDLELGFEFASGSSLSRAKARDQVRGQRDRVGREGQPFRDNFFTHRALDQELSR